MELHNAGSQGRNTYPASYGQQSLKSRTIRLGFCHTSSTDVLWISYIISSDCVLLGRALLRLTSSDLRLGENPAFIIIFYQFLADRFKESEYTGGFIGSILEVSNVSIIQFATEWLTAVSS